MQYQRVYNRMILVHLHRQLSQHTSSCKMPVYCDGGGVFVFFMASDKCAMMFSDVSLYVQYTVLTVARYGNMTLFHSSIAVTYSGLVTALCSLRHTQYVHKLHILYVERSLFRST